MDYYRTNGSLTNFAKCVFTARAAEGSDVACTFNCKNCQRAEL